MSFLVGIPVGNDLPFYKLRVPLSGILTGLRFQFNTRMNRWIMDVTDAQDVDLLSGVPLLVNRDLIGFYVYSGALPGRFLVTDDTNTGAQPTRNSFGTTHSLLYYDPTGLS